MHIQTLSVDPCRSANDAASVDAAAPVDERVALGLLDRGEPEMALAKSLASEKTEGRSELGEAGAGSASALLTILRVQLVAIFHRAGTLFGMRSLDGDEDREWSPGSGLGSGSGSGSGSS